MSALRRAVGQRRLAAHVARAVVRVRLHGLDLDVDRQRVRVGDRVAARRRPGCRCPAGRAAASPACASARVVAEVQADRRRHLLGLPARLHVQLDDEIGVLLEAPGEIVRQQRRDLARRPSEEVAVRIVGRSRDQPVVAGPGSASSRRATPASCRCGCWRGARPSGCRDGTRGRARSARSSTGIGSTKMRNASVPSAGSVYGCGSVRTRSGFPSCQPSVHARRLRTGRLRDSPSGAPSSAQRRSSRDLARRSADAGR